MKPQSRPVDPVVVWPPGAKPWASTTSPVRVDSRPGWLVAQPAGADEFREGWCAHAERRLRSEAPYCAARDVARYVSWVAGYDERDRMADTTVVDEALQCCIDELEGQKTDIEDDIAKMKEEREAAAVALIPIKRRAARLRAAAERMAARAQKLQAEIVRIDEDVDESLDDQSRLDDQIEELEAEMGETPANVVNIDLELGL